MQSWPVPLWRVIAFLAGLFCVWLAVGSPLAMLDHHLLTAHMAQHILLMTIAAPLILLGSPRPLFRLPNPLFCWFAAAAVLVIWHVPAVFEIGLRSELWHHMEHATFLAAGLLFWLPVIPSGQCESHLRWSIVLYLFLATLPCDALSAFLVFCGRVVYPMYLNVPRHFNLSPLEDQEFAGALMWTCATFVYLIPAVIMTVRLLSFPGVFEPGASATNSGGV